MSKIKVGRMANALNATVVDNDDGRIEVMAPAGFTFDGDIHCFVGNYYPGVDKSDAWRDLAERLTAAKIERCETPNCDWCNS